MLYILIWFLFCGKAGKCAAFLAKVLQELANFVRRLATMDNLIYTETYRFLIHDKTR